MYAMFSRIDWLKMFFQSTSRLLAAMCIMGSCVFAGSAQANPVVSEVAAADLPAYLKAHEKVVVLFTSPDRGCGFCVDADKGFEQAVKRLGASQWRYAIVQWSPWRKLPPEVQALGVGGIPQRVAFVGGKAVGWVDGRERNIDYLVQGLQAAQAGQKWAPPPQSAQARPAPVRPKASKEELDKAFDLQNMLRPMQPGWAEVQGRRIYLLALRKHCIDRHPQSDAVLRPVVNAWARKALPVILDPSQVGWLEREEGKRAVAEQEARFAWTMRAQTGLAHQGELDEQACERLVNEAAAVPLPEVDAAPGPSR